MIHVYWILDCLMKVKCKLSDALFSGIARVFPSSIFFTCYDLKPRKNDFVLLHISRDFSPKYRQLKVLLLSRNLKQKNHEYLSESTQDETIKNAQK